MFVDDFDDDSICPDTWTVVLYGAGPQVAEQNQRLEFSLPASSSGYEFGARLVSRFALRGDLDLRVDFRLIAWPHHNGVRSAIGSTHELRDDYGMDRSGLSAIEPVGAQEVCVADFGPFVLVPTEDFAGTLRLLRSGATQTGYLLGPDGWVPVLNDAALTTDTAIQLHAWSHDYAFRHCEVRTAFDDFTVMAGQLVWPSTPTVEITRGLIKRLCR